MIDASRVILHALPDVLRITIMPEDGESYTFPKPMSPRAMRILAISLFQAAEEAESNVAFVGRV